MPETLAQRIRAKYLGAYDDMSDEQLEAAVTKKYPGVYDDLPRTQAKAEPAQPQQQPTGTAFGMTMKPGPEADAVASADVRGEGLPPPFMVMPIGKALAAGSGAIGRAYAGMKAAGASAAPAIKYELAKTAMEQAGVPTSVAIPIAMLVAGYKRGGRAPAPAAAPAPVAPAPRVPANATGTQWGHVPPASVTPPAAARVSPVASPPVTPTLPAATGVPPSVPIPPAGPKWSPQRIRNEVGLAERRGGLKLTEAQREQADRLVVQGLAPKHAVQAVAGPSAPAIQTVSPPAAPTPLPMPKAKLSAAETSEYFRLLRLGKTEAEARTAIELQRGFARQFGTPSPEAARQAVAERNATGRWPTR